MKNIFISKGKIYCNDANNLEQYVVDCINDAAERLKDHNLVKEDPLEYVIKKIVGYDQAYDPQWQPNAPFAKHNLADTETSLDFIKEYYKDFRSVVEEIADSQGEDIFYPGIFAKGFDLVRLTVAVYAEIAHQIGREIEVLE